MESIKNWFQDWSDACEYAKECAPDMSFLAEPYTALASIAAVCFLFWWWNERGVRALPATQAEPSASVGELTSLLQRARAFASGPEKKAA
jgi:hypothetical protein